MTRRQHILLGLAIAGFVFANTMVTLFFIHHGSVDLAAYFSHWTQSLPAAQLTGDIGIAFIAFSLWAAWEGRRLGMRSWWMPVPASLLVGLCFALPLFLFLRERALRDAPSGTQAPGRTAVDGGRLGFGVSSRSAAR
jgi:putative Ca2+/H+ antiporter (TMEM165/GDT1 family)